MATRLGTLLPWVLVILSPLRPQYRRSLPVLKPSILRTRKRHRGKTRNPALASPELREGFRNTRLGRTLGKDPREAVAATAPAGDASFFSPKRRAVVRIPPGATTRLELRCKPLKPPSRLRLLRGHDHLEMRMPQPRRRALPSCPRARTDRFQSCSYSGHFSSVRLKLE
jgi:hypothetical protein